MSSKPLGRPPAFGESDLLDAALTVIKRDGVDGCTLRSVASELDVTAMALYRHVESKDDLLGRLPDHLIGDVAATIRGADDGIDGLRRAALALSSLFASHREVVPLFARPIVGPNMAAAAEACISHLSSDGYSTARSVGLLRATVALVVGLAVTGGASAEDRLGPTAADAVEVWLRGVERGD